MAYTPPHDTPFVNGTGPGPSNLVDADYLNRVDANQADADARLQLLETSSGNLTDIGSLTPSNNDLLQTKAGHWTNRTPAQVMTDMGAQPLDSDLTAIAALDASTAGMVASDGAGWIKKTYAQVKTALAITASDVGAQPSDSDLTAIAALDASTAGMIASDGAGWVKKTYAQVKTALGLTASDVGLGSVANAAQVQLSTVTTKGDLIVATASATVTRRAIGANGRVLAAASAQTDGVEWSANPAPAPVDLTDGATVALDSSAAKVFRLSAAGDRTLLAPTNAVDGRGIIIAHTASGAARTLTLTTGSAGSFAFGSDITALSQTVSGKTDFIGAIYNLAADRWRVISYAKGY